jgi:transposase
MEQLANEQPELPLSGPPPSGTAAINARCTLRCEGDLCCVCVAGLPMHHWKAGDRMAELYAMVNLVQCGYADQNDVARAFGYTARTLRNHQRRYESAGMAALGRSSGRPSGVQAGPSPWLRTASALKKTGLSLREIAQRLKISKTTAGKWLSRQKEPAAMAPSLFPEMTPEAPEASPGVPSANAQMNGNTPAGALDRDPANRALDRLLARMGKLDDAPPLFNPGKDIPRAGVLLAVPALAQSGIFSVAQEVYGSIGPAFYGLRTTILALLLLALLRIKRPEGLKEHVPADLGRLLGLDRAPEVKTLRRKLVDLAEKAESFSRKLSKIRVARRGAMMGFLYVDGHVRVYHGKRRIPKTYATRMRLALPATTDYWVSDKAGDPVFVVTAEFNEGLAAMLPKLLEEVRALVGKKRKVTIVFDRGGWSPKLFAKIIEAGFDILTYRKGKWRDIPRTQFSASTKTIEGRRLSYEINDRNIRLLKGRLRLRQITKLSANGHQTPIVTSRKDLSAVVIAYRMFERWRQENFFKYLLEEYEIDALADYRAEPENPERPIPNPERRKLDKQLAQARAKMKLAQVLYGQALINYKKGRRSTLRGFKMAYSSLEKQIQKAQGKTEALERRRHQTPKRIKVRDLPGEPLVRLSPQRKHLTNVIKMVAYQAESDLLALLRPHYARANDEGRTLITTALQSPADLELGNEELKVTLAPLSSRHRSKAIEALCHALNKMKVCFPGTSLRMVFGAAKTET